MRLILVLLYSISIANSFAQIEIPSKIREGLSNTYNLNFYKSDSIFLEYIDEYPNRVEGFLYLSQNHLWKFLGSRDEGEYGTFLKYHELFNEKFDLLEADVEESSLILFYKGWNQFLLSIAFSMQDQFYDAFGAVDDAFSLFEEAIDLNPDFQDPLLGIGLITYSLSYTPDLFKWILPLFGLDSDKEIGFQKIQKSAYESIFVGDEASYHYSRLLAEYKGDYKSSIRVLTELISKYPQNSLYYYQRAIAFIQLDNFALAKADLERILKISNKYIIQTNALTFFLLGEVEYFQRNYDSAISYYHKFIDTSKSIDYTGIANLRLAVSNKLVDENEEYLRCLRNASLGNLDIAEDAYANFLSELLIKKDLTEQIFFFDISNKIRMSKSISDLEKIDLVKIHEIEQTQKIKILLTNKMIDFGSLEKAKILFEQIRLSNIEVDEHFISKYFITKAKLNMQLGKINSVKKFLSEAESYNSSFFNHKIESEINFLEEMIKK